MNYFGKNPYTDGLKVNDNLDDFLKRKKYFLLSKQYDQKKNKLPILMNQLGIGVCYLERKTGISKQSLNAIAKGKTIPSVFTATKIAKILGFNVETVFPLSDDDWYRYVCDDEGKTLHCNIIENIIFNTAGKKMALKKGMLEYYDTEKKQYISKTERETFIKLYKKEELQNRYDFVKRNTDIKSSGAILEVASMQLQKEIDNRIKQVYVPIAELFVPYPLRDR